jgi:hypothetical protein
MEKNIYIHHINISDLKIQEIPKLFEDSMKEFSQDPENEENFVYWFISNDYRETQYMNTENIPHEYLIRLKYFLDSSQELVNYLIKEIKNNPEIDNLGDLSILMSESQHLKNIIVSYEQSLALNEIGFNDNSNILWKSETELIVSIFDSDESKGEVILPEERKNYIPTSFKTRIFNWFVEKYKMEGLVLQQKESDDLSTPLYYITVTHSDGEEIKGLFNSSVEVNPDYYLEYEKAESACMDKLIELAKKL